VAVERGDALVALVDQADGEGLDDGGVVVDDEQAGVPEPRS